MCYITLHVPRTFSSACQLERSVFYILYTPLLTFRVFVIGYLQLIRDDSVTFLKLLVSLTTTRLENL